MQMTITIDDYTKPIHYNIVDKHTGRVVATAKTRKSATRMVDARDNAYGAYRYSARPVYEEVR